MLVCGKRYTIIQNEKNEIYVCGRNYFGQLSEDEKNKFEKVEYDFGKIKKIACGEDHTVIQNEKNEIYVRGNNNYGQLGLGDNKDRDTFEKLDFYFGEIKKMVCGGYHTVIQNEKNEIYVCGANYYGQFGFGDNKDRNKFEKVEYNFGEIKNIACGVNCIVIQNEKNEIYVCGNNKYCQLGLGDNKHRNKFEKVEYDFGEIKNITCCHSHTIIQNEKNEIYICGYNGYGQLGLGDNKCRNTFEKVEFDFGKIKNIACGVFHTVIQNEKDEIYVCGYNGYRQLGLGDVGYINKFEKVDCDFGKIKNIACGFFHIVIQNEKNEIYVCGWNEAGQLGLGDNIDRKIFVKVNTDDIFEKIYNFELKLNTEEIVL